MRPGAWGAPEGPKNISAPPQRPSPGRKVASPRPNAPAGAQNGFAPPQRPSPGRKMASPRPNAPAGAKIGFAPPRGAPVRPAPERTTTLLILKSN